MNIWYLHHYSSPDCLPGLHRPFEFGKYFVKEGNKVTVFTSSYLHYAGYNIITDKSRYKVTDYDGISTVHIKTSSYESSGIKRIKNMFEFYFGLKKNAKKYAKLYGKPDIIIASSPHQLTMIAGIQLAHKFHVPCICEVRDFWPEVFFTSGRLSEKSLLGRYLLHQEKKIYTKASGLLFLKEGDHTYITDRKWDKDNGGPIDMSKCYYVNNGVDISLFDKRKNEFKVDISKDKKFTIVYCGTVRPVNHVDILVDVGKLLGDQYQILVYGSGNCVDEIKAKIEEEKVTNVILKGYIDNKYVPSILSQSDANILNYSSKDYNWSRGNSSNKLFEYLASAKPVISTVKMGYDIIEKYHCGFSSTDCEPELIVKCIKNIKELSKADYDKMCENARKASLDFDIPNLAERYLDVLKNVIRRETEDEK